VRRGWPLLLMAAAVAATSVLSAGRAMPPILVLLGLSAYLAASRLPRRISIPAAAAAAGVLSGTMLAKMLENPHSAVPGLAVESLLVLVAAWFVGDAAAARRRYILGLAEQAERERAAEAAQAALRVRAERVRIARELHDVVAHTLAVITVQAGVGRRLMASRPAEAGSALESIEEIGRTAQDELRVVLGLLRDEDAAAGALSPSPRLTDLKELAETVQASGTPVELLVSDYLPQLSPALELSVYRVVQEALTNVVKHAPHACATVSLTMSGDDIRIEVADDGSASGPAGPADIMPGHGIVGMRERVAAFGGWLVAEPVPGHGFRVLAEIPAGGTR
jgi:signal transduction histidine kinase